MRRCISIVLSSALSIAPVLVSAQGITPDNAQEGPGFARVQQEFRPTRRSLRKRARGRQASDASSFLEYRLEYRELQQRRTLENISPQQRRARALGTDTDGRYMERRGKRMMDAHKKVAPRRAPGNRVGKNLEYLPNNKRVRPGETRLNPRKDPCLKALGTRKSRCYYKLQQMTVPGS
jgi:hypothetical protein